MSDSDQLATIGQKLTAALTSAYGSADSSAALVFLPGGVTVPADLVQSGIVNPAQVQTFLETNFDWPFVVSPSESAVHGKDASRGTASQIYMIAATSAQPLGSPTDDGWKRVTSEIAVAQKNLGATNTPGLVCEPDDWVLPSNTAYWTVFNSTDTQAQEVPSTKATPSPTQPPSAPTTTAPASLMQPQSALSATATVSPSFALNPRLWSIRFAPTTPMRVSAPPIAPAPVIERPVEMIQRPAALNASRMTNLTPGPAAMEPICRVAQPPAGTTPQVAAAPASTTNDLTPKPAAIPPITQSGSPSGESVQQVTTVPASTITVQLQHQCVTLGYMSGGVSWWDGAFLADTGWFIPGMCRGALLPLPQATAANPDLAYGIPVALVVVQNLSISGNWSDEAAAALAAPGGSLGPFSLAGATATLGNDGTVTYSRPGMQVVAVLCSQLPVLPPVDAPATAPSAAPSNSRTTDSESREVTSET